MAQTGAMAEPPTPAPFAGFPAEAFAWFTRLEADNSRAYFTAARPVYDRAVRGALEAMLEELAAELGGTARLFRQHRDVRFSADKSPYKTRTYGLVGDRPGGGPALYAELSARGLFAGTGYRLLAPDQLARFRAAAAHEPSGRALEDAMTAVRDAGAETFGETVRTAPRGYPRDHPRVRLLRHRSLIGGGRLAPGPGGIGRVQALGHARAMWAACEPICRWLEAHVGESETPPDARGRRR